MRAVSSIECLICGGCREEISMERTGDRPGVDSRAHQGPFPGKANTMAPARPAYLVLAKAEKLLGARIIQR